MGLLAVSLAALSACGGGGGSAKSGSGTSVTTTSTGNLTAFSNSQPVVAQQLNCLDANAVSLIQADPLNLPDVRTACASELSSALSGLGIAADESDAIFAALATTATLFSTDPTSVLTPDEQFALQAQTYFQILRPNLSETNFHIAAVFGGALGRRAEVAFEGSRNELILDPWTGVVAVAQFDQVFSGQPLPNGAIRSFLPAGISTDQIVANEAMLDALQGGSFRPSDLLYFQPGPDFLDLNETAPTTFTTNGENIAASYTTPGGYRLAVDQYGLAGVPIPQNNRFSSADLAQWTYWNTLAGQKVTLTCLTPAALDGIRADPTTIAALRSTCDQQLTSGFAQLNLTSSELDAVFVAVVAHGMAPYGENSAILLPDLLQQTTLECSGYALIAGYLLDILSPNKGHAPLRMLGYQHPVFGNHAQLLLDQSVRDILIDPTTGMVAVVPSFDALMAGYAIDPSQIQIFYQYAPAETAFVESVYNSIRMGKYRPSDLLYFSPSAPFLAGQWGGTVTSADLLMNQFLTPGGYRKAVQIGLPD